MTELSPARALTGYWTGHRQTRAGSSGHDSPPWASVASTPGRGISTGGKRQSRRPSHSARRSRTVALPGVIIMDKKSELRDGYAEVGDQRLHYVEAGEGPLILLLHGFPEFWYGWRQQIEPLAAAGFRGVAPHPRGYNPSSKPTHVAAYDTPPLTPDIPGLIQERG